MCFARWPLLLGCKDFQLGTADRNYMKTRGIKVKRAWEKNQIHDIQITMHKVIYRYVSVWYYKINSLVSSERDKQGTYIHENKGKRTDRHIVKTSLFSHSRNFLPCSLNWLMNVTCLLSFRGFTAKFSNCREENSWQMKFREEQMVPWFLSDHNVDKNLRNSLFSS